MRNAGCAPHSADDIIPDGQDHYFRLLSDRKDKRGGFCLTVESDGFAWGNFRSFKTGQSGKWHSGKAVKAQTKEERAAIDARIKALQATKQAETDKRHAEAAIEAQRLWNASKPAVSHPYLDRKHIEPNGARIDGHDLIYQGVSDGKIWMYQRITPDGEKLNQTGAKKQGTFFPMTTAAEPKDVICVCEGIATAASVREATGLPVVAAWDTGNLAVVAKQMREKYKTAKLIFCADNDCDNERNAGIFYAQQAAGKVGGFVVWPEMEGKPCDWNDAHQAHGLDYVRDKILAAIAASAVAGSVSEPLNVQAPGHDSIPVWEDDGLVPFDAPQAGALSPAFDDKKISNSLIWKKWPSETENGKMEPNSLHNILVFLRHKSKYLGLFRYDRFAGRVIVHKQPFWHSGEPFKVRELRDSDISYMTASMEKDGLGPTTTKVYEAINVVAAENWIDPPLDYLNRIVWDGVERHGIWLEKAMGASGDKEYLAAIGSCVLIAIVARQFDPGCKAENMLVLEGGQGVYKSTALALLANIGQGDSAESYFCDTLTFNQIEDKDTVLKLKGKMIVEFPDLAGMSTREVEAIKAWMSVQVDEIRVPYGREMMKFKRRFIPFGSTNQSHWLVDQTGNRRFWPVKCGNIAIEWLREFKEQLLAEAVYKYKNKGIWWIPKGSPLLIKAEAEQGMRLLEDIWFEPVERFADRHNFVTVREILESMKIEVKDQTSRHQKQVINILKRLGFSPKVKRQGGSKPISGWGKTVNAIEPEFEEIEF